MANEMIILGRPKLFDLLYEASAWEPLAAFLSFVFIRSTFFLLCSGHLRVLIFLDGVWTMVLWMTISKRVEITRYAWWMIMMDDDGDRWRLWWMMMVMGDVVMDPLLYAAFISLLKCVLNCSHQTDLGRFVIPPDIMKQIDILDKLTESMKRRQKEKVGIFTYMMARCGVYLCQCVVGIARNCFW